MWSFVGFVSLLPIDLANVITRDGCVFDYVMVFTSWIAGSLIVLPSQRVVGAIVAFGPDEETLPWLGGVAIVIVCG